MFEKYHRRSWPLILISLFCAGEITCQASFDNVTLRNCAACTVANSRSTTRIANGTTSEKCTPEPHLAPSSWKLSRIVPVCLLITRNSLRLAVHLFSCITYIRSGAGPPHHIASQEMRMKCKWPGGIDTLLTNLPSRPSRPIVTRAKFFSALPALRGFVASLPSSWPICFHEVRSLNFACRLNWGTNAADALGFEICNTNNLRGRVGRKLIWVAVLHLRTKTLSIQHRLRPLIPISTKLDTRKPVSAHFSKFSPITRKTDFLYMGGRNHSLNVQVCLPAAMTCKFADNQCTFPSCGSRSPFRKNPKGVLPGSHA